MYKIGIIGDKDSILGFKTLGFSIFAVTTASEAERALRQMEQEQYAVAFITEQTAGDIIHVIEEYTTKKTPAVIPIPGTQGSLGIGMESVKKSVERAVGADILFNDE